MNEWQRCSVMENLNIFCMPNFVKVLLFRALSTYMSNSIFSIARKSHTNSCTFQFSGKIDENFTVIYNSTRWNSNGKYNFYLQFLSHLNKNQVLNFVLIYMFLKMKSQSRILSNNKIMVFQLKLIDKVKLNFHRKMAQDRKLYLLQKNMQMK